MEPDHHFSPKPQLLTQYAIFAGDPTPRLISLSLSEGISYNPCHLLRAAQALPDRPDPTPRLPSPWCSLSRRRPHAARPLGPYPSSPLALLLSVSPPHSPHLCRPACSPSTLPRTWRRVPRCIYLQQHASHTQCSYGVKHGFSIGQTQGSHRSMTVVIKDGCTLFPPPRRCVVWVRRVSGSGACTMRAI